MGIRDVRSGYKRPLGSFCGSAHILLPFPPLGTSDSQWLGTQPPPTPPLPPSPQVRLPAGICLDRLRLGVVHGVMAVRSGCHPRSHTPSSKPRVWDPVPRAREQGISANWRPPSREKEGRKEGARWAKANEDWPKSRPETQRMSRLCWEL